MKKIRAEKSIPRRTGAATSTSSHCIGVGDPELARALRMLKEEHGLGGLLSTQAPDKSGCVDEVATVLTNPVEPTLAQGGSERSVRSEEEHKAKAKIVEERGRPKGEKLEAPGEVVVPEQGVLGPENEAIEGLWVRKGLTEAAEGPPNVGDDEAKSILENLLLTSRSVALAVAQPLRTKSLPILVVEENPRRVS